MTVKNYKVFISYSWTSNDHCKWVLKLASDLRKEEDVVVRFDKFDLHLGDDKYYFMEQMADSDYVIVVCDKEYASKANVRKGGVGTESMILTPEAYSKVKNSSIIPVIREKGEYFDSYLPIYLKSKIALDMTDDGSYKEKLDELLNHVRGHSLDTSSSKSIDIKKGQYEISLTPDDNGNLYSIELSNKELNMLYEEMLFERADNTLFEPSFVHNQIEIISSKIEKLEKKEDLTIDERMNILEQKRILKFILRDIDNLTKIFSYMLSDKLLNIHLPTGNRGVVIKEILKLYQLRGDVTGYFKMDVYKNPNNGFGVYLEAKEIEQINQNMNLKVPLYNHASELPKEVIKRKVIPWYVVNQFFMIYNGHQENYEEFDLYSYYCSNG